MKKDYLPSKDFIIKVSAIIIIIALVFGIYEIISYFKNKNNLNNRTETKLLVKDVVEKDSNANGIADWEESLWGFNPNINGPENKEAINAKKKELAKTNGTTSNQPENLTDNEIISRQFFALIMSLQESGNLNEATMAEAAKTVGDKVNPTPLKDAYTISNQTIKSSNKKEDMVLFAKNIKPLLEKHSDLGKELGYISTGVENKDATALKMAVSVASSYRSFSKEFIKIPVPNSLASTALNMANNYEKVAQSIEGLAKISEDPLLAMKSLINYKNYNEVLTTNTATLSSIINNI